MGNLWPSSSPPAEVPPSGDNEEVTTPTTPVHVATGQTQLPAARPRDSVPRHTVVKEEHYATRRPAESLAVRPRESVLSQIVSEEHQAVRRKHARPLTPRPTDSAHPMHEGHLHRTVRKTQTEPSASKLTEPQVVRPRTSVPSSQVVVSKEHQAVRRHAEPLAALPTVRRMQTEPSASKLTELHVVRPRSSVPPSQVVVSKEPQAVRRHAEPLAALPTVRRMETDAPASKLTELHVVRPKNSVPPSQVVVSKEPQAVRRHAEPLAALPTVRRMETEPSASKLTEPQVVRPRTSVPSSQAVVSKEPQAVRRHAEPLDARPKDRTYTQTVPQVVSHGTSSIHAAPPASRPTFLPTNDDGHYDHLRAYRLYRYGLPVPVARQREVTPPQNGDQGVATRMRVEPHRERGVDNPDITRRPKPDAPLVDETDRWATVQNLPLDERPAGQVNNGLLEHEANEGTESEEEANKDSDSEEESSDSEEESSGPGDDTGVKPSWDAVWVVQQRKFVPDIDIEGAIEVETEKESARDSESNGSEGDEEMANSQGGEFVGKLVQANSPVGESYVGSSARVALGEGSDGEIHIVEEILAGCPSDLAFPAQGSQLLTHLQNRDHNAETTETCDEVPENAQNVEHEEERQSEKPTETPLESTDEDDDDEDCQQFVLSPQICPQRKEPVDPFQSRPASQGIEEIDATKVSIKCLDGIRSSDVNAYAQYITGGSFKYNVLSLGPQQNTGLLSDITLEFSTGKQAVQFVEQSRVYQGAMHIQVRLLQDANRDDITDFLELQCRRSERKIQQSLLKHQEKIDKAEQLERGTHQKKMASPVEFEKILRTREALMEKLRELKLQRSEFIQFTDQLKEKLMSLSGKKRTVESDVASIRRRVGLEMKKLSVALPIYARRSEIVDTIQKNQVCVVLGETGSGKSTQLPQYMYDAGYGDKGAIACTQPRKVAATSLAKHVAQELGTPPGKVVGHKLGASTKVTKITYMTDHTLMNECINDPLLKKYSCVIIDEAHERTVYTDLLIGMIKKCLVSRPDLRVVITSATIDPEVFIRYFDDCPLVRVSGRMFPVDVTYIPGKGLDGNFVEEAVRMTLDVHRNEPAGDILVFLTSPVDIEKACGMMVNARNQVAAACILPLHGRLQPAEQQLVFEPTKGGRRKIVFATNCAETSLTIPGIKYVIDTGLAKEKIYDGARNTSSLVVKYISQSSANQRKGRAGRMESGKCYRLYAEEKYTQMDTVTTPEIFRVHLGQALTKLMELGVKDPLSFEFVQAPPKEAFITAMTLLEKLGASKDGVLTDLGRKMAKFSLEPRLAKFVLEASDMGIAFSGTVVAALCTLAGSIFFRAGNEDERTRADKLKVRFCDQQGDILTMLFAFKEWDSVDEKERSKWCMKNSFNAKSMRIVRDALKEIKGILTGELAVKVKCEFEEENRIREIVPKLLLSCFCDSLAVFSGYDRAGYYICEKDMAEPPSNSVQIHPSSAFRFLGENPQWVVYSQVLTTSQSFILNITSVQEDWIEEFISKGVINFDMAQVKSRLLQVELTGRVGRTTGRRLVGAKFTKLNELQDQIREASGTASAFLAMNLDIGRLQLIGSHAYDDQILDLLKGKVDCEKTNQSVQLKEDSIAQGSKVRLLLASGGTLKNVLMPHEYRTVLLEDVPVEMNEDEIMEWCSHAGPVADCFKFKETGTAAHTRWGKVTFIDPVSAKHATENPSLFPFVARPAVGRSNTTRNNFQAKVEWCRKLPKGFAFVGFTDEEDAEMARSEMYSLQLYDHRHGTVRAVVKPGKNYSEIYIGQLPKWVTGDVIRRAIEEQHPLGNVQISKVSIPRENEPTMGDDVNGLRKQLTAKVKQYYQPDDINVTVLKPKPHQYSFTSYVSFGDAALGMQAVESMLDDNVSIRNQLVTITPIIETSMIVRKDIHAVTDKALETMIEELENEGNVSITQSQQRGGDTLVRVKVNSSDMTDAANALGRLQSVTKGVFIDVTMERALQQLTHPGKKGWLRSVEKRTRTFIQVDRRQMQVAIYGEKQGMTTAEAEIGKFLKNCASQEVRQIVLKGEGLPAGLMKKLFVTHGIHLTELQTKTGAGHLEIDVKQHKLSASGSKEALDRVQNEIDQFQQELESQPGASVDEETGMGDCPICLCPVALKDCYILECCGHPYCKGCIENLVGNAIRSRDFPVQCAAEDCGQLLFICDLTEILKGLAGTWTELQGSSLDSYLVRNKEKYKCCITPNCQMVYSPSNDGTQFSCDICNVNICTTCHVQYHHGITCDMFKVMNGMKKEDISLKKWLMKDPLNRAICPKCKAPILKDGGCQSVRCGICKTEMCWLCKKTFQTDDDTYRHIRRVHNRPNYY